MRKIFPWFYRPSNGDFKIMWNEGLIVLDTNVLLNLYRYSKPTVGDLFRMLEELKDRLWLPHQVAYEFSRRRLDVILGMVINYENLHLQLEKKEKEFYRSFDASGLKKQVQQKRDEFNALLEKDTILERIERTIPVSHIGQRYSKEDLENLYKEAQKRFEAEIPPGFGDWKGQKKKKEPDCYSDYILWRQILDHAQKVEKHVIFVTEDNTKGDWFYVVKGRTIGPHPKLREEFHIEVEKNQFYIYRMEKFLDEASEYLQIKTSEQAKAEVHKTAKQVYLKTPFETLTRQFNMFAHALSMPMPRFDKLKWNMLANALSMPMPGIDKLKTSWEDIGKSLAKFGKVADSLKDVNVDIADLANLYPALTIAKSIKLGEMTYPQHRDKLKSGLEDHHPVIGDLSPNHDPEATEPNDNEMDIDVSKENKEKNDDEAK